MAHKCICVAVLTMKMETLSLIGVLLALGFYAGGVCLTQTWPESKLPYYNT